VRQVLLMDPILRVLIESNGGGGLHELSVWLDSTILDEILLLAGVGLGYKRGKIAGAYLFDLILIFHPRIVPTVFLPSHVILFLCC
jgi:hypothetical protein